MPTTRVRTTIVAAGLFVAYSPPSEPSSVIQGVGPDCECEFYSQTAVGAGNNNCVQVTNANAEASETPICDIECCGTQVDCEGTVTVMVSIANWGICCRGGNPMLICLNGAPYQNIPPGFGGVIEVTMGGTSLPCSASSDSEDIEAKIDALTITCGTNCGAGVMWTANYTEFCDHCPEGDKETPCEGEK